MCGCVGVGVGVGMGMGVGGGVGVGEGCLPVCVRGVCMYINTYILHSWIFTCVHVHICKNICVHI